MRRRSAVWTATLLLGWAGATAAQPPGPAAGVYGFSAEGARHQRELESKLDALFSAQNLRQSMQQLTAHPHHVGSRWDKANAEWMASQFRSWGYDTAIEEFWVLFPTPKERKLELLAPSRFVAGLDEEAIPEDSTSSQKAEQLPTYNAYSVDGDVTGELVYVNYGLPDDYEELARHGISVEGKIAIARYGGSWRGIKPKVAAEHGAIGCLIFSDPSGDGYAAGDPYPKGGWRPEQGVQRGSVKDAPLFSGDPLTPFIGATKDAPRVPLAEAKSLTRIPVLPISARDARALLAALGGPVVPGTWRGALPIAYHFGPGPAKVHLKLAFNWDLAPLYDVIARMPGSRWPDQWVIRGNHHDAWVNGASDPVSGMVALLEEARAVGELARQGERPARTLIYAGWDGEEPGLLGSTEWAELHEAELAEKAVAYINSDSNARGFFGAGGSHALETLVDQVAADVTDPETGVSVADRLRARARVEGSPEEQRLAADKKPLRLSALGSGSDYTPFLQHLGIASLNIGYGDEEEYGQYHSIYDSFDHYVRFVDPTFVYGVALAKTGARLTLRLANADVPAFEPGDLTATLRRYVDDMDKLTDRLREETATENARIRDGVYKLAADPTKTSVVPEPKPPVPFLDFSPLKNAMAELEAAGQRYASARKDRLAGSQPLSAPEAAELSRRLFRLERSLTSRDGLPGRPWYRHLVYAPGFYTGYGVKTLPAIREAIELRKFDQVPAAVTNVASALTQLAKELDEAAALWRGKG